MPINTRARTSLPSPVSGLAAAAVAALLVCSAARAAEPKLVVTTDPQSQPESFTEAPDGSLIIASASKPAQLDVQFEALKLELSDDQIARLTAAGT